MIRWHELVTAGNSKHFTFAPAPVGRTHRALEALPPPRPAKEATKRRERTPRMRGNLPVVEEVVVPEAVQASPEAWRKIGEEISEQIDFEPARFLCRRLVRPKYVRRGDADLVPIVDPLPPVLQERCLAAPGLIAQVLVARFCDPLPLYRANAEFRLAGVESQRRKDARRRNRTDEPRRFPDGRRVRFDSGPGCVSKVRRGDGGRVIAVDCRQIKDGPAQSNVDLLPIKAA